MLQKLLVAVLAFVGAFIVVWYGNFSGKLPAKGTYFGFAYDSVFIRSVVTQFEYLWLLIIINLIYTLVFQLGYESFKNNFLTLAVIWLSMSPIAALVFNSLVLKERVSITALIGVGLLILGSVLVMAHKEVSALFAKF